MAEVLVAILRHGQYHQPAGVPSAHLPHPLTELGCAGSRRVAGELLARAEAEGWRVDAAIHTSTLLRAWETAQVIAAQLAEISGRAFEVQEFDALCERGLGSAANLSLDEIARVIARDPRFPDLTEGWKARSEFKLPLPGAESLLEAGARVAEHLQSSLAALASQCSEPTLRIVVGHGAALRHAAYHLGLLGLDDIQARSMFHCVPIIWAWQADGPWRHVAGDWKMRERSQTMD